MLFNNKCNINDPSYVFKVAEYRAKQRNNVSRPFSLLVLYKHMASISVINFVFESPVICLMIVMPVLPSCFSISPPMLKQCAAMAPNNQLKLCIGNYAVVEILFKLK